MDTIQIPTAHTSSDPPHAPAALNSNGHVPPHVNLKNPMISADDIGELLYRVGFWLEYTIVCTLRTILSGAKTIFSYFSGLLRVIFHPIFESLTGVLQDLTLPFITLYHSAYRIVRGEKRSTAVDASRPDRLAAAFPILAAFLRGILAVALPVAAAVALYFTVQHGREQQFLIKVTMNGQTVGNAANEQVFESARSDVQERLNNAHNALLAAGLESGEGAIWEINPSYFLISGADEDPLMSEGDLADAMMRLVSTDISEATAVYIDGELQFVTSEGDHLRAYLENYRVPQDTGLEPNTSVSFLHEIRLVDGLYMNSSVVPLQNIISAFNAGAEILTYTAARGETVQSAVDNTGISFESLSQLNPDLTSLDQKIPEGTVLTTGTASPELLKLKVTRREIYEEPVAFPTENSESSEYNFGDVVVLQEGVDGVQRVTADTTFIDNVDVSHSIVQVEVVQEPIPRRTVTGTHLDSGLIASIGTGSFIWPVPDYTYISRWANFSRGSQYHRGTDICANYGTPIIASDGGAVVEAGWHGSWGNYVRIDHGNGWTTLYAHMSRIAVSRGQAVEQGQVIGYVGSTGNSNGNHCHFEMTRNGVLYSAYNLFSNMPMNNR